MVAASALLARADASDQLRLAESLGCDIPLSWPPQAFADVRTFFAEQLEKGAALPGWWSWYGITRDPRVLIGSAGFTGRPDSEGTVTLGYSIAPGFEGRGFASEMVAGLVQWAASAGRVARVHATTFERHYASVRVLEKNGFVCRGVSSEDAGASDADRQGRGCLMLFVRALS